MTVFTDTGNRVGGYIISEADGATGGMRSRDTGVLASGTLGLSGLVVAKTATAGKYAALTAAAPEDAAGILFSATDASLADAPAVFSTRAMEANDAELIWPDGITAGAKAEAIAALKEKGIIVR